MVWSDRALQEQDVSAKKWMRMRTKSKRPMIFDTGGGEVTADLSLLCASNLFGQREAYYLKDAPFCVPQGIIVEEQFMPYEYIPGLLPFHVTDCSALKVICPEKYRKYADRDDEYIPIFKENLRISVNQLVVRRSHLQEIELVGWRSSRTYRS